MTIRTPKRILLADDEPMVLQTLRMVLSAHGHSVETTCDGKQALKLFEAGHHDLVITDFKMGNTDGLELAKVIKNRSPSTRVILLTAYADAFKESNAEMPNIDMVLGKACSVLELQAALEKVFSTAAG